MTLQRFTATSVTNGGSLTGKANAYQLTGMTGSLLYMVSAPLHAQKSKQCNNSTVTYMHVLKKPHKNNQTVGDHNASQRAVHVQRVLLSTARNAKVLHHTLTCYLQAPESYNKSEYNEKVDVFSFAMIMFELLMYELTYYAMQCRDQVSDLVTYVEGVCIDGDRCVLVHGSKPHMHYVIVCVRATHHVVESTTQDLTHVHTVMRATGRRFQTAFRSRCAS